MKPGWSTNKRVQVKLAVAMLLVAMISWTAIIWFVFTHV